MSIYFALFQTDACRSIHATVSFSFYTIVFLSLRFYFVLLCPFAFRSSFISLICCRSFLFFLWFLICLFRVSALFSPSRSLIKDYWKQKAFCTHYIESPIHCTSVGIIDLVCAYYVYVMHRGKILLAISVVPRPSTTCTINVLILWRVADTNSEKPMKKPVRSHRLVWCSCQWHTRL